MEGRNEREMANLPFDKLPVDRFARFSSIVRRFSTTLARRPIESGKRYFMARRCYSILGPKLRQKQRKIVLSRRNSYDPIFIENASFDFCQINFEGG